MQHTLQSFVVDYFKKHLKDSDKSQNELAANIEVSRQIVSNYLTGKTEFSLKMFERFADGLQLFLVDIVGEYHEKCVSTENRPSWVGEMQPVYEIKKKTSADYQIQNWEKKDSRIRELEVMVKRYDQIFERQSKYIDRLENEKDDLGRQLSDVNAPDKKKDAS